VQAGAIVLCLPAGRLRSQRAGWPALGAGRRSAGLLASERPLAASPARPPPARPVRPGGGASAPPPRAGPARSRRPAGRL